MRLNIGSGGDTREGWINLNLVPLPGVDIVHDLEKLPLPFADDTFDEILAQDILEHVEYVPLMKELHRILKSEGKLNIRVPHYTSRNNFTDPTHKKLFSLSTFDYFTEESGIWRHHRSEFYFTVTFKKLRNKRIIFDCSSSVFLRPNRIVEWLVNRTYRSQLVYEMTGLCYLFPAGAVELTLIK